MTMTVLFNKQMLEIYLRKRNKVLLPYTDNGWEQQQILSYVLTANRNLEDLGYTFSMPVIERLKNLQLEVVISFYGTIVGILREFTGANKVYRPMYPNFPQQVMEASNLELYFNAFIHYLTEGKLLPYYEKEERYALPDFTKLKVIELGNQDDFLGVFQNLISSKTSISEADKEDLRWFAETYSDDLVTILPDVIPLKENVGFVSALVLKHVPHKSKRLYPYFKTATDVLRLAVAMSDGDVSLAADDDFRNLKRSERRFLLDLLENCNNIEEDMLRYRMKWIRLAEKIHPTEPAYKNKYVKVIAAFTKLRNNGKIETFGGKINQALDYGLYELAIGVASERPGEMARRLDELIRKTDVPMHAVIEFEKVAKQVSVPVLLQVLAHFRIRQKEAQFRAFIPKGNVSKMFTMENNLEPLSVSVCQQVMKVCKHALIEIFSERPSLGKVYVDAKLDQYFVPFAQRSASKSLRTVARGSRMDINPNAKVIRAFLHWMNMEYLNSWDDGRVDIDLSAVLYDANWNFVQRISFRDVSSHQFGIFHSGDITSAPAPDGACEFIDIDVQKAFMAGARYVIITINSYTHQPYADLPECSVGWMEREAPESGEIFEPRTVISRSDVTADTQIAVPVILDLVEHKAIWVDLSMTRDPEHVNDVDSNLKGFGAMCRGMATLVKPTLYDLFELHAYARGQSITTDIEEADTVFSIDKGVTPFDFDIIASQYL